MGFILCDMFRHAKICSETIGLIQAGRESFETIKAAFQSLVNDNVKLNEGKVA